MGLSLSLLRCGSMGRIVVVPVQRCAAVSLWEVQPVCVSLGKGFSLCVYARVPQ